MEEVDAGAHYEETRQSPQIMLIRSELEYCLSVPAEATEEERAAITAGITEYLVEERNSSKSQFGSTTDAWTMAGRYQSATGHEMETTWRHTSLDGWKLAARANRF